MLIAPRLPILLIAVGLLTACRVAPFDTSYRGQRSTPERTETAWTLDNVTVELIAEVTSNVAEPSPAFSPDSQRLVYSSRQQGEEAWDVRPTLHIFNIALRQDTLVHTYVESSNYAPMPLPDQTAWPSFLDSDVILSGTYDLSYNASTQRLTLSQNAHRQFSDLGTQPRSNPQGTQVLLHHERGVVVTDRYGQELERFPGFSGVWAPEGERFVIHKTPPPELEARGIYADASLWPETLQPAEGTGGLVLVQDGELRDLTTEGFHPTWHPDGKSFVYARFAGETWRWVSEQLGAQPIPSLFHYDLATGESQRIAEVGRKPHFHPSGQLLVYASPGGITLTDMSRSRALEIAGREALFSPDGRFLVVLVPTPGRDVYDNPVTLHNLALYRLSRGQTP